MSHRKQIKKQRHLEQERNQRSRTRRVAIRNSLAVIGAVVAGIAVIVVVAIARPFSGDANSGSTIPVPSVVLAMQDDFFDPAVLTIKAGQTDIRLLNQGRNPHNVWLVGPGRKDIRSKDLGAGDTGALKVKIDEPGEYNFVCTFHAQMGGKLIVEP